MTMGSPAHDDRGFPSGTRGRTGPQMTLLRCLPSRLTPSRLTPCPIMSLIERDHRGARRYSSRAKTESEPISKCNGSVYLGHNEFLDPMSAAKMCAHLQPYGSRR